REFYARVAGESARPVDPEGAVARHLAVYAAATAPLDARVLTLIEELRRRHVVACLTNTEVEVGRFNRERGLYRAFDRAFLFTDACVRCRVLRGAFRPPELGPHTPARALFERVLAELGCAPAEAVFTDDNMENAAGARAASMHAIHYRDFEGFSRALASLVER